MLAVSEDKDAAQLMGVNVNGTISLTFAIGSGLAAIAGVLFCSAYPTPDSVYRMQCLVSKHLQQLYLEESVPFREHLSEESCLGVIEILGKSLYFFPAFRCDRVCSTDHCAACEAYRYFGQDRFNEKV